MDVPRFASMDTLTGTGQLAPVDGYVSDETTGRLVTSESGATYQSVDTLWTEDGPRAMAWRNNGGYLFAAGKR